MPLTILIAYHPCPSPCQFLTTLVPHCLSRSLPVSQFNVFVTVTAYLTINVVVDCPQSTILIWSMCWAKGALGVQEGCTVTFAAARRYRAKWYNIDVAAATRSTRWWRSSQQRYLQKMSENVMLLKVLFKFNQQYLLKTFNIYSNYVSVKLSRAVLL